MDSKQKSRLIHCPICGGKTKNSTQQRAGRLKHRACYPIFYREQALFGAYNFVSFVTQQ